VQKVFEWVVVVVEPAPEPKTKKKTLELEEERENVQSGMKHGPVTYDTSDAKFKDSRQEETYMII